jgi:hypothetical protein
VSLSCWAAGIAHLLQSWGSHQRGREPLFCRRTRAFPAVPIIQLADDLFLLGCLRMSPARPFLPRCDFLLITALLDVSMPGTNGLEIAKIGKSYLQLKLSLLAITI